MANTCFEVTTDKWCEVYDTWPWRRQRLFHYVKTEAGRGVDRNPPALLNWVHSTTLLLFIMAHSEGLSQEQLLSQRNCPEMHRAILSGDFTQFVEIYVCPPFFHIYLLRIFASTLLLSFVFHWWSWFTTDFAWLSCRVNASWYSAKRQWLSLWVPTVALGGSCRPDRTNRISGSQKPSYK